MFLVSKNGEQAIKRVVSELQGSNDNSNYDPLMAANFAIWNNALSAGGMYLMGVDERGNQYCPLCELVKHAKVADGQIPADEQWIEGCCDGQLSICREMGLVPKES